MEFKPHENDENTFIAECKTVADIKYLKMLQYFTHNGETYTVKEVKDGMVLEPPYTFLVVVEKYVVE